MKNRIGSLVLFLFASSGMAATKYAICTNTSNKGLMDEKHVNLEFSAKNAAVKTSQTIYNAKYLKIATNGSTVFVSPQLTSLCDQCDLGYIFISPELAKGTSGIMDISVRQLGDSTGSWWLKESFNCRVK